MTEKGCVYILTNPSFYEDYNSRKMEHKKGRQIVMRKVFVVILAVVVELSSFAYSRSSVLGGSLRQRRLDRSLYGSGSSISTYSNVKGGDDSYEVGCMREIGGKRCGSKRVEGSLYCYNCKQIVDRERESRIEKIQNEYNRQLQEIDAAQRKREQAKQQRKKEIRRLNSSKWNVYFETLQEQHDRILTHKPAPSFPPDGLED